MAWTDDLTFAIMAKATDLTKKVTFLLSIITDTMAEHAMKLSYGQGKTTVVLAYRGWKAVRERQKMEKQMGNKIALPTAHGTLWMLGSPGCAMLQTSGWIHIEKWCKIA